MPYRILGATCYAVKPTSSSKFYKIPIFAGCEFYFAYYTRCVNAKRYPFDMSRYKLVICRVEENETAALSLPKAVTCYVFSAPARRFPNHCFCGFYFATLKKQPGSVDRKRKRACSMDERIR